MSEDAKRLLSVQEAAAYLSIAAKTVYAWIEAGQIPYVAIGRRRLLDRAALDVFIKANTRPARAK